MDIIILNDGLYSLVPVTKNMLESITLVSGVNFYELCDLLRLKLTYIDESKKVFGNLEEMPGEVQQVIVNMCFNMGAPRLSQFKKFIRAIHDEEWATASLEMLDSKWANQVGERANRLSDRIKAIN